MAPKDAACSECGAPIARNTQYGMCSKCWHKRYNRTHRAQINARINAWKVAYRQTHRAQIANYAQFERFRLRLQVIDAYGGKCVCCGETESLFLTIDHIYRDGKRDRERMRGAGITFYRYLRREGFPKERYRLLCFNCNTARGFWGVCPHEIEATPAYSDVLSGQASFRLWRESQGVGRQGSRKLTVSELDALWAASGDSRESVASQSAAELRDTAWGQQGYETSFAEVGAVVHPDDVFHMEDWQ